VVTVPSSAPIVNAAGFVTTLGGAPLEPEVADLLAAASQRSWDVAAVAEATGARLAELCGAPAACVVAGTAAGLVLSVAAVLAGDDPGRAAALPRRPGAARVVVQTALHSSYDRVVRLTGVDIEPVGYASRPGLGRTLPWQIEEVLGPPTVAVLHTVADDPGAVPLADVTAMAHQHGVPVIVDAAAQLPPVENLSRFLEDGADLVIFSGGKALRGPQGTGLVLGRADLVSSIRVQQEDMDVDPVLYEVRTGRPVSQHGIGRAMKVGADAMLALTLAVERFVVRDHQAEADALMEWLTDLIEVLGVGELIPPGRADSFYPSAVVRLKPDLARRCAVELAAGTPSVMVSQSELNAGIVRIRPEALEHNGRDVVRNRLVALAGLLAASHPTRQP
jgi:L-seryl-tRNA(Ser) seleniumtransferase